VQLLTSDLRIHDNRLEANS